MELSLSSNHAVLVGQPADSSFKEVSLKSAEKRNVWERFFPTGFKHELKELIKYSWPIVITMCLNILIRVSGPMFAGHIGKYAFDAASMAISLGNLVGTSIGIGLIAACDTLFSQSYGSTNKLQVGVYLQTAIYVCTLGVVVSWAVLMNTNNILLLLGQDPIIAKYTEDFLFIFMPSIFCLFLYQLLSRYLQVQGNVIPALIVGIISNAINAILQYVLIYVADMGLAGSATALLIGYLSMASLMLIYILYSKAYARTWGGWTRESLKDWGQYMKLGLSSVMMICLEWWTFEVAMFLMGILGSIEMGANSIMYQIWMIYCSVSLGTGSACAYRVGRYLGSKNVPGAITSARVSIVVSFAISIVTAIITFALQNQLPLIFTSDPDIIQLSSEMIPILALFTFFGASKNICAGIVRGTGKQIIGGIIAFVAYILCALPIGIPLMFLTQLRAAGFWWGLNIGLAISCVAFMAIVFTMNWDKEMEDAQVRAKVRIKKISESAALLSQRSKKDSTTTSYQAISNKQMCHTETYWKKLTIWRLFIVLVCLGLFAFGVVCRFVIFIPPPLNTTFTTNNTLLTLTFSSI